MRKIAWLKSLRRVQVFGMTGAIAGTISLIGATIASVAKGDAGWAVAFALAGIIWAGVFGLLGILEYDEWARSHKRAEGFCTDCGQAFVKFESQSGFDRITGKPNMDTTWRCPDWVAMAAGSYGLGDGVDCGNRARTSPTRACNHTLADMSCQNCVESLVRRKVITRDEANTLLGSN